MVILIPRGQAEVHSKGVKGRMRKRVAPHRLPVARETPPHKLAIEPEAKRSAEKSVERFNPPSSQKTYKIKP